MKKKFIAIILIIMMILLSSCNKANDDNATIQLWYYDFNGAGYYSEAIYGIISKAKMFCDTNKIPLEVVGYNENTISHEDYVLKRNAAAAAGNMITIDDARFMHDIAKQHADYTKLDNYNNLLSAYKDRFCIPLGVGYRAVYIENEAINYYDIDTEEPLITYGDYLTVKQKMKEKGAKFELNITEYYELLDYYLDMNGLLFINEESEILKDNNKFKELLKKSILEVCNDIILYNDGKLEINNKTQKQITDSFRIYDENSKLTLSGDTIQVYDLLEHGLFGGFREDIFKKTFVIDPEPIFYSPCFYMYKKITNDKIYDLANYLVSESTYLMVTTNKPFYSPVFNMDKTREVLSVDNNWEYSGIFKMNADRGQEVDKRVVKLINTVYELLVKNDDKSEQIANYYFYNKNYSNEIKDFISNTVYNIASEKFDYKNEEINNMIDNKIDEFITNFNVHYN